MSGSISDIIGAQNSGNVLNAIAHPAQLNLLGAYQGAAQTANSIFDVRRNQAQQQIGQLATESIDSVTKQFDPNVFNAKIAAAGPGVAMGAQAGLQNAATLNETQYRTQAARLGWYNGATGALPDNATRDQIVGTINSGVRSGMLTPTQAQNEIAGIPTDPTLIPGYIQQHRQTAASAMEQFHIQNGTPTTINAGNQVIGANQSLQTGALTTGGSGVTLGLTPEQLAQPHTWTDASGQSHQGTVGTYLQTLGIHPPTGGQQTGGGATTPPGVPPPGTIPPNPNAPAGTPPGRIVPPPALTNPNKPLPSPPPPAPGVPATPPTAAPTAPAVGANIPGPAPGTSEDITAYKADQAAVQPQVTRIQNMQHAYDALSQLKSATGKGAQGINDLRSYAQTLGILPAGAVTEQQLYEVINKYTERAMLDAAGGSGTDLARQMQAQANPNTGLSTPANLELLRNDLGTSIQKTAASALQDPTTNGVGYLKARGDLARNTDPRGFVWSFYSPDEQAKILAEVKGTPADEKLHRAIGMSLDPKLQIPQVRPPSVQQKQSFNVPPPAPVQNLLQMTG